MAGWSARPADVPGRGPVGLFERCRGRTPVLRRRTPRWIDGRTVLACVAPPCSSAPRLAEGVAVLLLTSVAVAEVSTDPARTGPLALHLAVVGLLATALLLRRQLRAGAPIVGGAAVVVQSAVGFAASAGELVLYLLLAGTAGATSPPQGAARSPSRP
jgi:hypothetical protein